MAWLNGHFIHQRKAKPMPLRYVAATISILLSSASPSLSYAPPVASDLPLAAELADIVTTPAPMVAQASSPYWAGPGLSDMAASFAFVTVLLAAAGLLVLYTIRSLRRRWAGKTS